MSTYYPDLPSTSFPDALDAIPRMSDITADDLPNVAEYERLMASGDRAGAAAVLAAHPELVNKIFNAEKFNQNRDAILAIQRMWNEDISQYLVNIVNYRGEFSPTARYVKYDVVQYRNGTAVETYMCISASPPIGTDPTVKEHWVGLTLRGEMGEPGIGLTAYGAWDSSVVYPINAMVSHNNVLWQSVVENPTTTPGESDEWISIFDVNDILPLVIFQSDEVPTETIAPDNADQLQGKSRIYYENVSGHYTGVCVYEDNTYTITADDVTAITKNVFHITFKAPSDYVEGASFIVGNTVSAGINAYIPAKITFRSGDVVTLTFDVADEACRMFGGSKLTSGTYTLAAADWAESSQTITVPYVNSNSILFVSPDPANMTAYCDCAVYAYDQGLNTVSFLCNDVPEVDLRVIITNGGEA